MKNAPTKKELRDSLQELAEIVTDNFNVQFEVQADKAFAVLAKYTKPVKAVKPIV